jgi:hypothetical protein
MDCKEFRQLLDLYVDGELSPEGSSAAREHRETCVACKRAEEQLLLLRTALKHVVNKPEPPLSLVSNIKSITRPFWRRLLPQFLGGSEAMESQKSESSFWQRKVAIPTPALALMLTAILSFVGWTIVSRNVPEAKKPPAVVRKSALSPASSNRGFDLTQFDRGDRAEIYKVRLSQLNSETVR